MQKPYVDAPLTTSDLEELRTSWPSLTDRERTSIFEQLPRQAIVETDMIREHEFYMERAFALAVKSYAEGGCPIGAVLVDNTSGDVLGEGHNALVQEGNPIVHGEMAALRAAGRMPNRHTTTMYTTLQPCFMCTGAIVQFGIPRVVIGDVANASSDETLRFLRGRGVEVIVLDCDTSPAARQCVELAYRFRQEKPDQWFEDWGGGPNPKLF